MDLIFISLLYLGISLFSGCAKESYPGKDPDNPDNGRTKTIVWSDEFDYAGLPDANRWTYDTEGNSTGWGNNESQYYTNGRPENVEVRDGFLTITAIKEEYEGFHYTSARLRTKGKGDWLYGRFEIRARLPDGRGMWPAIWMLPTDWAYGGWPESGEIDIMENVGYDPFDKRFHLLLNVAVGGNWGGAQGVDDTIFPRRMMVDYVRVYQYK